MSVRAGGGGGGGVTLRPYLKNVNGLSNYFFCLSTKCMGPMGLWIVFDGFFVFQEGIKGSRRKF